MSFFFSCFSFCHVLSSFILAVSICLPLSFRRPCRHLHLETKSSVAGKSRLALRTSKARGTYILYEHTAPFVGAVIEAFFQRRAHSTAKGAGNSHELVFAGDDNKWLQSFRIIRQLYTAESETIRAPCLRRHFRDTRQTQSTPVKPSAPERKMQLRNIA